MRLIYTNPMPKENRIVAFVTEETRCHRNVTLGLGGCECSGRYESTTKKRAVQRGRARFGQLSAWID